MDNKHQNSRQHELKNSDFLAWRVGKYQRKQQEKAFKNIFYTRERDSNPLHH